MKRKTVWLVLSGLMVAALVLGSCAPAVVEEEEEKKPVVEEKKPIVEEKEEAVEEKEVAPTAGPEMVTLTLTKRDGTKMTKEVEKPKYGGTITSATASEFHWDPGTLGSFLMHIGQYNIYEVLAMSDWWRGKAGTGEIDLGPADIGESAFVGLLAESWEHPDPHTYIFHLRQTSAYGSTQAV